MCIFSGPVNSVSKTRIFGRVADDGMQYLVYQMQFSSAEDVAMILPFPNDRSKPEPEFINLESCPNFFDLIDDAFPNNEPVYRGSLSFTKSAPLKIHSVGAFEASVVPTIEDFDRLDSRFRFAEGTLNAMVERYKDYSFAVFKLKAGGNQKVHPMAFKFYTTIPNKVFYPTVHVHDGKIHDNEQFDHTLYAQIPSDKTEAQRKSTPDDDGVHVLSDVKMTACLSQEKSFGIINDDFGFKMKVKGYYGNEDLMFDFS